MSQVLDAILVKDVLGTRAADHTIEYESINASGNSESLDVSGSETGYLADINYDNGSSLNIEFVIEVSADNMNWAPFSDSAQTITDTSGNVIIDVTNTNVNFVRVAWTVTSGSVDAQITIFGRRRH